jgi:hypothetical protein
MTATPREQLLSGAAPLGWDEIPGPSHSRRIWLTKADPTASDICRLLEVAPGYGIVSIADPATSTADAFVLILQRVGHGGRPSETPPEIVARIQRECQRGRGLPEIARGLEHDGIPTPRGGERWSLSTIAGLIQGADL